MAWAIIILVVVIPCLIYWELRIEKKREENTKRILKVLGGEDDK